MGVKGSDIRIARNDGIAGVAGDRLVRRIAEAGRRALPAPTTATCTCRATAARLDERDRSTSSRTAEGDLRLRGRAVARFDEATVYATFDGHRHNDFETYIYASTDLRPDLASIDGNLKGEVARTLTEDMKNPDVLYLGTETGLFVTLDRGATGSGSRPTCRPCGSTRSRCTRATTR